VALLGLIWLLVLLVLGAALLRRAAAGAAPAHLVSARDHRYRAGHYG